MTTKILLLRSFVLKVPKPDSKFVNLLTGEAEDSLDIHLNDGWTLLAQSATAFNNEERLHFTLQK